MSGVVQSLWTSIRGDPVFMPTEVVERIVEETSVQPEK